MGLFLICCVLAAWGIAEVASRVWPLLPAWVTREPSSHGGLSIAQYGLAVICGLTLGALARVVLEPVFRLLRVPMEVLEPDTDVLDYPFRSKPKSLEELARRAPPED